MDYEVIGENHFEKKPIQKIEKKNIKNQYEIAAREQKNH